MNLMLVAGLLIGLIAISKARNIGFSEDKFGKRTLVKDVKRTPDLEAQSSNEYRTQVDPGNANTGYGEESNDRKYSEDLKDFNRGNAERFFGHEITDHGKGKGPTILGNRRQPASEVIVEPRGYRGVGHQVQENSRNDFRRNQRASQNNMRGHQNNDNGYGQGQHDLKNDVRRNQIAGQNDIRGHRDNNNGYGGQGQQNLKNDYRRNGDDANEYGRQGQQNAKNGFRSNQRTAQHEIRGHLNSNADENVNGQQQYGSKGPEDRRNGYDNLEKRRRVGYNDDGNRRSFNNRRADPGKNDNEENYGGFRQQNGFRHEIKEIIQNQRPNDQQTNFFEENGDRFSNFEQPRVENFSEGPLADGQFNDDYRVTYDIRLKDGEDGNAEWDVEFDPAKTRYEIKLVHPYGAKSNVYFTQQNNH